MELAISLSFVVVIFIISAIGQTFNKPKLVTSSKVMVIGFFLGIIGYYVYHYFL